MVICGETTKEGVSGVWVSVIYFPKKSEQNSGLSDFP